MKFTLLLVLTLISSTMQLRLQSHEDDVSDPQAKLEKFMKDDDDLFGSIISGKTFTQEQQNKIIKWMLSDDDYSKYLASLVPQFKPNKFLEKIKENSPVDYLQILFQTDEKNEAKQIKEEISQQKQEAKKEDAEKKEEKKEETKEEENNNK